ncbi:protein plastid movement impaired 2 [Quercus suber]|uniref:Protein plastid movement impaired 2 n=1 Tax=Quercus suber TaxID=58331 RepID=A0AAW0JWE7_QUESU
MDRAKLDNRTYGDSKRAAELARAQTGSQLPNAKKTVKDLFLLIKESNMKAKAQMQDFEMLKKSEMRDEGALAGRNIESYQYEEVMRELEFVKLELSKLKLHKAYVLEEKSRMEKEVKALSSKMLSYLNSVKALRK